MRNAYIILFTNVKTLLLEHVGVYSEQHPTTNFGAITSILATFSHKEYGKAADKAEEYLSQIAQTYPSIYGLLNAKALKRRGQPAFYCGKCQTYVIHNCPGLPTAETIITEDTDDK